MGRLIDADSLILEQQSLEDVGQGIMEFYSKEQINNAETVEAIPKEQYGVRLKADVVAILTELSMKIGEIEDGYTEFDEENKRSLTMIPLESVERLIDGEINKLKAESEEKDG